MKKLLLASTILLALAAPADACTKWWKGGGSSTAWNATVNTNWSDSDGGANNATVPGASDDVCFNGNSGVGTSNMSTSFTINSLNMTGYLGTLTIGSVFTAINGTPITFGGTITPSGTAAFQIANASTQTVWTSAGQPMPAIRMNVASTSLLFADDYQSTIVASCGFTICHEQGILDANNKNVTVAMFQSNTATTRTLTMGSGTWKVTMGGTNTIWSMSTVTGLTLTPTAATIEIASIPSAIGVRIIALANIAFPKFLIDAGVTTSAVQFSCAGGCTLAGLTAVGPNYIQFTQGQTTVVSAAPTVTGSLGSPVTLTSVAAGGVFTMSVPSGTMNCIWCAIRDMTATGGATFVAGKSFNLGNNTGITITPPAQGMLGG